MTVDATAARRRTSRNDLLDDLLQAATPSAGPVAPTPTTVATAAPQPPSVPSSDTPALELRLTPWSWTLPTWRFLPAEGGWVISVGPVRLSLGLTAA